ncbi:zinc-binding protein A33-like isoform X2 [Scyliorhinus torazame]|uniref:zinc-binding protein A33-like isoform X2 n=1 Tax=Scyliorhinus torazame TaxID=75743 RepID=UPI003B5AC144
MEAGGKISWLEDELSCPICQDIFRDPVSPPCQHNFCCACLMSYWKKRGDCECPVCRETYSSNDLKWNRTLANIVESFLKEFPKEQEAEGAASVCAQHREVLKLFCQDDQQVICVVCLHSRKHENHKCRPLEEAAKESKEKLKILMKSLKAKVVKFGGVRNEYQLTVKHIKDFPATRQRANCTPRDPEVVSAVINVGRYVGSLQYKVWKKMLNIINTASVTLDPNTAAPWLCLSEDLTMMGWSPIKQQLPDNPERFDSCVSVLGLEGFTSGRHHWDVDVTGQSSWCLGVAKESIQRKGIIKVDPENGFWTIGLMDGNECYAYTSPWRTELSITPNVIRVYLDYKSGKVSFYNLENMCLLYTFTHSFTEKIYPYFCPYLVPDSKNVSGMKIYPQKVVLQD